jgi:sec-independent protein translocase protein TatA
MGGFSLWHWVIVGLVVMLLFGRGRFSAAAGDIAKGIKSFKKGLAEDDSPPAARIHIAQKAPQQDVQG